jgi:hypothetical protein
MLSILSHSLAFLSSCTGSYSGTVLANYTAGLKVWHLLYGHPWIVNSKELKAILDGASALAPATSKFAKCNPFTVDTLVTIHTHINHDDPLDTAIFTCITTSFYSITRLGEFTVPSIKAFNSARHITHKNILETKDHNGLTVKKFHIPGTKISPIEGEDTYRAAQIGPTDLQAALENHLHINPAERNAHLFAWQRHETPLKIRIDKKTFCYILEHQFTRLQRLQHQNRRNFEVFVERCTL